ncbi:MAG: hypothetical protein IKD36_00690 [Clostridia bacterium]|nr:hypothetical protein [Clostridia bacterium]
MGLFGIFKKNKQRQDIPYKFNFDKAPELLKIYKKYRILELDATKFSMSNTTSSTKKFIKATEQRNDYAYKTLAKAVYDKFNIIKPTLHKRRGEEGFFEWDVVFDKPFEELSENQLKCLVGLFDRKFVYELPDEYYND